jgi:hypothetical protein
MSARCSGACCRGPMYLSDSLIGIRARLASPIWSADVKLEAAKILSVFRRDVPDANGHERCSCGALTAAGCSLSSANRPVMCNDFPYAGGKPCPACGARSDAEARGVALELAARPIDVFDPYSGELVHLLVVPGTILPPYLEPLQRVNRARAATYTTQPQRDTL